MRSGVADERSVRALTRRLMLWLRYCGTDVFRVLYVSISYKYSEHFSAKLVLGDWESVKLHQRHKQTNERTDDDDTSVCLFVCPFVSVRGINPMGGQSAMLHRNLRGRGIKIRDQPINTGNVVGWLSGKSLKLPPPDVQLFKAEMHQIRFLVPVRLRLRCESDAFSVTQHKFRTELFAVLVTDANG